MENAADAIRIGFAVIVFTLAIALTFNLVSQAKATSDHVLYYTDETNFYEYAESSKYNRVVPVSELIAILHRYYIETIAITVKLGDGEGNTYLFDSESDIENTDDERQKKVEDFILNHLNEADMKFTEEFVEAPISGMYEYGEDGTEIVIAPGGTKLYVTYTLSR